MRKIAAMVLALFLGASTPLLAADQEAMTDNTTTEATAVAPTPPNAYAAESGCGCQPAGGRGSCWHRLIGWLTYCPKERIGCCKSCNSCQYKGSLPIHLIVGRYCAEGSGIHPTLPPDCCHGCAHGSP
jgi:hypothetical protein